MLEKYTFKGQSQVGCVAEEWAEILYISFSRELKSEEWAEIFFWTLSVSNVFSGDTGVRTFR